MTIREFREDALEGFAKLKKELREDMEERDLRDSFVRTIVRGVLGWKKGEKDGRYEVAEIRDVTLYDDKDFPIVIIETKSPSESIKKKRFRKRLENRLKQFGSEYGVLTNGHKLFFYSYSPDFGMERKARINIDSLSEKELINLSQAEKDGLSEFRKIKRIRLLRIRDTKYLADRHRVIDISTDEGFDQLIAKIRVSLDGIMEAVRKYFNFYSKGDNPQADFFKKAYDDWCSVSNMEKESEDSVKTFCRETAYVILNRMLFTRVLDDKKLIAKAISGKGLAISYERRKKTDNPWIAIFKGACENAKEYYEHFYLLGMFDWWKIEETKRGLLNRQQESELEDCETRLNESIGESLKLLNPFNFELVDRDILGHIYQQYLPPEERKELGEFYTPLEVVKYILNSVEFKPRSKIENKYILDPACGSGTFLVEAVNRILQRYKKKGLDLNKPECAKLALEGIIEHIHGLDINPFACHIAETNLLFQVIELYEAVRRTGKYKDYTLSRFNIYTTDSLVPPKEGIKLMLGEFENLNSRARRFIEERRKAEKVKKKRFDFVVGNPPWGGILKREKGSLIADELRENFFSAHGKFDIYVLFMELGLKLLKEGGVFGYITQNRYLKADYAKKIREFILENATIEKIVDFGDTEIFADATNYPCITILNNQPANENEFEFIEIKTKADELDSSKLVEILESGETHEGKYFTTRKFNQNNLRKLKKWEQNLLFLEKRLDKVENWEKLGDLCDINEGVTFGGKGSDDIFCVDKRVIAKHKIEDEIYGKVLKGKDIRKYVFEWNDRYLIYPYDTNGNLVNLEEYPKTRKYLEKFKENLEERVLDGKHISEWSKSWYSFWRERKPEIFTSPKIVSPRLATHNRFSYDKHGEYFLTDSSIAVKPRSDNKISMEYLLGLLNSRLMFFIVSNSSTYVQNRYYSYSKTYLESLPLLIPKSEEKKRIASQIEDKVKRINELMKQSISLKNKFDRFPDCYQMKETNKLVWLIRTQELDDDSYKISKARFEKYQDLGEETKYKFILKRGHYVILDNEDQAEYLIKLLENRERITREEFLELEIPSMKELHEIMEEFHGDKDRIKEIENEVEKLEREIDNLVYDLYDFKGEVETVENFLKRTLGIFS